eukprot:6460766-Amphidinium_carterae.1
MWAALTHACARLCHCRRPWAKVAGPAAALVMSAARLGWSIQDVTTLTTDLGVQLNLERVSAKYLCKLVSSASGRWSERFALWHRGVFEDFSEVPTLWLRPLHDTVAKLRGSYLQQKCLQSVAAGGRWTQHRLFRKGMATHSTCLACKSAEGTDLHRVLHCEAWESYRCKRLSADTRHWLAAGASGLPLQLLVCAWAPCHLVASPPAMESVVVNKGPEVPFTGKVFTDGSVKFPQDAQMRRAGFAIVAVDGEEIIKLSYGCVPVQSNAEQTVEAAETYA